MKALILYLKEVPHTVESVLLAAESCKTFDVEPQLFEGYVPSKANCTELKIKKVGCVVV